MANLFIGFPVPRAKIADMIAGAAPPLEHYENHEPDGSDPIVLPVDISPNQILQWNGTKFVGAEPAGNGGLPSPISIHPSQFHPIDDQIEYYCDPTGLRKRSSLASSVYYAPVLLPNGVTVTSLTLYAFCNHMDAYCNLRLYRVTDIGDNNIMASANANWINGHSSRSDTSISYALIDTETYSYCLYCFIDPGGNVDDSKLTRVQIDFE